MSWLSDIWDKAQDAIKESAETAGAKILSSAAEKLLNKPAVKQAAKEAAGNKVGNYIMDNWQMVIAGIVILIIITVVISRKR